MNKILKKVQLSTEQSTPKSVDPTKGTKINPYTQEEMATLQEEGTWDGGYVEGMGYIVPMMDTNDISSDIGKPINIQGNSDYRSESRSVDGQPSFTVYFTCKWDGGLVPKPLYEVDFHVTTPQIHIPFPTYEYLDSESYLVIDSLKMIGTSHYPDSKKVTINCKYYITFNKTIYKVGEDPQTQKLHAIIEFEKDVTELTSWAD
jgi:hypothetical protein